MSTPRPTEADMEAAESAVCLCEHSTADHAWYGCAACGCRRSAIQALLASDWLAARDAEHQREVEVLRASKEKYHEQWMLAEQELADMVIGGDA